MKKILMSLISLFMTVAAVVPVQAEEQYNQDFDDFTERYFTETLSDDYMSTHYAVVDYQKMGIEMDELTLGEATLQSYQDAVETDQAYLDELLAFDYDSLSETQKVDYCVLKRNLEIKIGLNSHPLMDSCFNAYSGVLDILNTNYTEFVFRKAEEVPQYLQVLKTTDGYLMEALELTRYQAENGFFMTDTMLDEAHDAIAKFVEKTDDNQLIVIFDENVDACDFLSDSQKAAYKAENREYILNTLLPTWKYIDQELEKLRGSNNYEGGLCNYENGGRAYYEALVRSKTSTDESIEELFKEGETFLRGVLIDYVELLYFIDPDIQEKIETESLTQESPEEVLEYIKSKMSAYPEYPEVDYEISYLDESVANDATVAYYMEPCVDDITHNVIRVNPTSVTSADELYGSLAHEGYPGHLYQITYYLNTNPSYFRTLTQSLGYVEGWAMYSEVSAFEFSGYSESVARYYEIETTLGYVLDAVIDLAVHGLGWNVDDVGSWLEEMGLNAGMAQELYDFVLERPGMLLPYGIGMMKFLTLREEAETALGEAFDAVEFHEVLLNGGDRPFELVSADVENYILEKLDGKPAGVKVEEPDIFQVAKPQKTVKWPLYAGAGAAVLLVIVLIILRRMKKYGPFKK